jgi:hypothetical protein
MGSARAAPGADGGREEDGRCGRADSGTVAERRMGRRHSCGEEEDGAVHGRAVAELAPISLLLSARAAAPGARPRLKMSQIQFLWVPQVSG